MTPETIASSLNFLTESYLSGEIKHEDFVRRKRFLWEEAYSSGCADRVQVLLDERLTKE